LGRQEGSEKRGGELLEDVVMDELDPLPEGLFELRAQWCAGLGIPDGEGVDNDELGKTVEGSGEFEALGNGDGVRAEERGGDESLSVFRVAPPLGSAWRQGWGGEESVEKHEGVNPFGEVDESGAASGVGGDVNLGRE
jgi:hypothetical protein